MGRLRPGLFLLHLPTDETTSYISMRESSTRESSVRGKIFGVLRGGRSCIVLGRDTGFVTVALWQRWHACCLCIGWQTSRNRRAIRAAARNYNKKTNICLLCAILIPMGGSKLCYILSYRLYLLCNFRACQCDRIWYVVVQNYSKIATLKVMNQCEIFFLWL
jgi:hypothetical protein